MDEKVPGYSGASRDRSGMDGCASGDMPLSGYSGHVTGSGAAAAHARVVLDELGATEDHNSDPEAIAVTLDSRPAVQDWAESGAMALTGRVDGPPMMCPGAPAAATRAALAVFAAVCRSSGSAVGRLPGIEILGERAALFGRGRHGPWSVGRAFRVLPAVDSHLGISLPRPDDLALLPALIEGEIGSDPWHAVADWSRRCTADEAAARAQLLGIAAAPVPRTPGGPGDDQSRHRGGRGIIVRRGGVRRFRRPNPLVLDLTSLWAGPLCAHLLGLAGAQVVKVESTQRPDGSRSGRREFFDLMHAEHASVAVDLTTPYGVETLRRLVDVADLVLEASRPRALRRLGIDAEAAVDNGTSWLSITAYGRTGPWADRIGFGDDVAAAAGAVVMDRGELLPCGDALADPVTGVHAAAAAAAVLAAKSAFLVDVSMRDVLGASLSRAGEPHQVARGQDGNWRVRIADDDFPVLAPRARRATSPAAELGADTDAVLSKWLGT